MRPNAAAYHRLTMSLRSEKAAGVHHVRAAVNSQIGTYEALQSDNAPRHGVPLSVKLSVAVKQSAPLSAVSSFDAAAEPALELDPTRSVLKEKLFDVRQLATAEKTHELALLNDTQVKDCTKCRLSQTRLHTVFGEGDVDAKIFFIGEGPGETEDKTGRPFVGRAGQLLDKMIAAMGLSRSQVFIANIVKCRPPENRVPAPDEVATCTPYLVKQLEIIRPAAIVTLGLPAVKYMLEDAKLTMGRTRGVWQMWRGIKLMPTYHPSYVLRAYTEANRQAVWSDLQMVMKEVGLQAKPRV